MRRQYSAPHWAATSCVQTDSRQICHSVVAFLQLESHGVYNPIIAMARHEPVLIKVGRPLPGDESQAGLNFHRHDSGQ